MWAFFVAIPILFAVTLNNCSQIHNQSTGSSSASGTTILQTYSGDQQTIARESTSELLVARMLLQTGTALTPVQNISVTFTSSLPGSFLYNPLVTDSSGSVRNFFTSGTQLGTAIITATAANGYSTQFTVQVLPYAPTSIIASTTSTLEYVVPSLFNCPLDFDEIPLNTVNSLPNVTSIASTAGTPITVTQSVAALQQQSPTAQNLANATDTIDIGITTIFPSPITSGECTYIGNIPNLITAPCDAENGSTFSRNSLAYSGLIGYQILSNGVSNFDFASSNTLNAQVNGLRKISLNNATANDNASNFTPFQAEVYFTQQIAGATKLMRHVSNTMFQISNINPSGDDQISNLVVIGNYLYFSASNGSGINLYRYNGSGNIQQISNINPSGNDQIANLITDGQLLYFTANNGTNVKLYQYNPTGSSIVQISNINSSGSDQISNLFALNNVIYFNYSSGGFTKLYKYNNQSSVISQLTNIVSGGDDNPTSITSYNNVLYFAANSAPGIQKLFSYNGTAVQQISNIQGSALDDQITDLTAGSDGVYFAAQTPVAGAGTKLFKFDGTNLNQISNMNVNGTDGPSNLVLYANKMYFRGTNDGSTYHIFRFDGPVISQVTQIMGAGIHDNPQNLGVAFSGLYFTAYDLTDPYIRIYRYCNGDSSCVF
jgi:hypothetical protein